MLIGAECGKIQVVGKSRQPILYEPLILLLPWDTYQDISQNKNAGTSFCSGHFIALPKIFWKLYNGLRNFTKFTGKQLCQSLFFNKVAGLRPATLLKKRFWHRFFPVNFVKFLRTPFFQNTSGGCFFIVFIVFLRHCRMT